MEEIDEIDSKSKMGLKGILKLYFSKTTETGKFYSFFWGIIVPLIITVTIFILLYVFKMEIFPLLIQINDISLVIIPTLLGFTLAAYTIFIGFGGMDFHKKIVSYDNGDLSLYQKTNAIFAVCILIESTVLVLSVIIKIGIYLNIVVPYLIADIVNNSVGFLLILLLFYSVISIYHLSLNIFNITQIYHVFVYNIKIRDQIAKLKKEKN